MASVVPDARTVVGALESVPGVRGGSPAWA